MWPRFLHVNPMIGPCDDVDNDGDDGEDDDDDGDGGDDHGGYR